MDSLGDGISIDCRCQGLKNLKEEESVEASYPGIESWIFIIKFDINSMTLNAVISFEYVHL